LGTMVLGSVSSVLCYYALQAKTRFGYDDSLDCFGIHGIGSGSGVVLLCFFIRESWMSEAASAAGAKGWSLWNQLGVQLTGVAATMALAGIGTLVICFVVEKTVGFRLGQEQEMAGLDYSLHGEHGYGLVSS